MSARTSDRSSDDSPRTDPALAGRPAGGVRFAELVALVPASDGAFVARPHPEYPATRVFGGQLLAQALWAAGRTAAAASRCLEPNSLHASFLRAVDARRPVGYRATELKAGRNLSAYRVDAHQDDRLVFTAVVSLEAPTGDTVTDAPGRPPSLPAPEDCWSDPGYCGAPLATFPATDDFEVRFAALPAGPRAFHPCWVRARQTLGSDVLLRACAVAFVSDMGSLNGCVPADEAAAAYAGVSLDHTLHLGAPARLEEWHALELRPRLRFGRRGTGVGELRAIDATIAALIEQEGYFPAT